jgi:hypothetical protein
MKRYWSGGQVLIKPPDHLKLRLLNDIRRIEPSVYATVNSACNGSFHTRKVSFEDLP